MGEVVPFVLAALIAPAVAVVEFRSGASAPFTLEDRAWLWWTLRLAFEVGIAIAAVAIVNGLVADDEWAPAGLRGLVIGASVPALARSYFFSLPQRNSDEQKIGIAYGYDLVRAFLESRIVDIETEADSRWAQTAAYPELHASGWTAETLAFRLSDVARNRLRPAEYQAFLLKLETTLKAESGEERKLRDTIGHARDIRAYRTLRAIVKRKERPPDLAPAAVATVPG